MMSRDVLGIIDEILSRLPVKSLLRFKCVCNSWKSIIESPSFAKLHLQRSATNANNSEVTIIAKCCDTYEISTRRGCRIGSPVLAEIQFDPNCIRMKPLIHGFEGKIYGCYHGLLALSLDSRKRTVLLNPLTRKCRKLPEPPPPPPTCPLNYPVYPYHNFVGYGLGFDSLSDDYKFVKMDHLAVFIYSMKNNEWKKVQDLAYTLTHRNGVFIGNALYWIAYADDWVGELGSEEYQERYTIVALDLGSEEFREVPLPEFEDDEKYYPPTDELTLLGGYLSCVRQFRARSSWSNNHVDTWVMKKHPGPESWTKLLEVSSNDVFGEFNSLQPLIYSNNKDEVLFLKDMQEFFWYNLKAKRARIVRKNTPPYVISFGSYVGSFVSPEADPSDEDFFVSPEADPSDEDSEEEVDINSD